MMAQSWLHTWAEGRLRPAGITINGPNPWDIQVHDPRLFWRVMRSGSLGLGEAYMDHWWDCEALDEFFERILRAKVNTGWKSQMWEASLTMRHALTNMQSIPKTGLLRHPP